jgi:hypothetical protein
MSISSIVLRGLMWRRKKWKTNFKTLIQLSLLLSAPLSAFLASSPMKKNYCFAIIFIFGYFLTSEKKSDAFFIVMRGHTTKFPACQFNRWFLKLFRSKGGELKSNWKSFLGVCVLGIEILCFRLECEEWSEFLSIYVRLSCWSDGGTSEIVEIFLKVSVWFCFGWEVQGPIFLFQFNLMRNSMAFRLIFCRHSVEFLVECQKLSYRSGDTIELSFQTAFLSVLLRT